MEDSPKHKNAILFDAIGSMTDDNFAVVLLLVRDVDSGQYYALQSYGKSERTEKESKFHDDLKPFFKELRTKE